MKTLTITDTRFAPAQKMPSRFAELASKTSSLRDQAKRLSAQIFVTSLVYLLLFGFGVLMLTTTGRPI